MKNTETYTQITSNRLLALIADDDLNNLFVQDNGNLYPQEKYSFDLKKLKKEKFFLREITGGSEDDK